ncbi:thiol-disulfide isomerase [Rufibacter radiotolerans]|uniref:Thiol-disulfide isomerase n=1 Tax=Rufibacter radiotolerans TaxID=1379910 RepID=A0A0H4VII5_9BACT|nr:thioredoxin family protein [Rufibacter radiotolerans]AKQ45203.1 thiol-disulfide isomerase [Rufibacter radiotolerans]
MNLLVLIFSSLFTFGPPAWVKDIEQAKKMSKENHKYILVNFSGSDWCGPCIKMEKEIFENPAFQTYATQNLVMVNADFPRQKKHQLDPKQKSLNEKLADQYNKTGIFPLTVLLDENGKVVKRWEGMPAKEAQSFIAQLQTVK